MSAMRNRMITQVLMLALLILCSVKVNATEVGDSIDTFQNQTVTTTLNLQGRNTVTMNNVTVTPTGHLTVTAPRGVVIPANFEVQLGGTLYLDGQLRNFIRFYYDASGNRTLRKSSTQLPEE